MGGKLVTRSHRAEGVESVAQYSPCDRYRYGLTRVWDASAPRLAFVMLNPSTATEAQNDPTIERCQRRAQRLGFGAVRICNLFAWRETDPRALRAAAEPVGPANDAAIASAALWADSVVAAWGVHGVHLGRGRIVAALLRDTGAGLFHLGLSKEGHPRHPLYISYAQPLLPWDGAGGPD